MANPAKVSIAIWRRMQINRKLVREDCDHYR